MNFSAIEKRESFISEETLKSRQHDDIGATVELPHQGSRAVGGTEPAGDESPPPFCLVIT